MAVIHLLVVATLLCNCLATIPSNYILEVNPSCGNDSIDDAAITIVTDLHATAEAVCANGVTVNFTSLDIVHLQVPVSYPGRGSSDCVFIQRQGTRVYVVKVVISYGEPGQHVHQSEEEFTISCVFDPRSVDESLDSDIQEGLIAPKVIQNTVGTTPTSVFTLQLTDVLGSDGELGLRPVGCDAVAPDGGRYAIIRAGCGDGIIFKKDDGFITDGLVARSPYFEAFGIEENGEISFECNFTTCEENCNGSSCETARDRREVPNEKASPLVHTVQLHSNSVFLRQMPVQSVVSESQSVVVDTTPTDAKTTNALYWTAMLGLGLIVLTSLAVSVSVCSGLRRVKVAEWNKA